jgi:ketosteroid isomerase-like protein
VTFRETLERHLRAIRNRDMAALESTVSADNILVVTSDGRLVSSTREFLQMHRDWFQSTTWSLDVSQVSLQESADLGVAVFKLRYIDQPAGQPKVDEQSYLTLAFARRDERWEMILDQNTPCRKTAH